MLTSNKIICTKLINYYIIYLNRYGIRSDISCKPVEELSNSVLQVQDSLNPTCLHLGLKCLTTHIPGLNASEMSIKK
jgi:hypothetical protein